jgi:hypothetical protein
MLDAHALLADVPGRYTFATMDQQARKDMIADRIGAVLDAIEGEGRQPDRWEAGELGDSIRALRVSWHASAMAALEKALAPSDTRADGPWDRDDNTYTIAQLRGGLAHAAATPLHAR